MLSMLIDDLVDVSARDDDCDWRVGSFSSCVTIINGIIVVWLRCELSLWLLKLMIMIMLIGRKRFLYFSIFEDK
jgi:hypothetical protein